MKNPIPWAEPLSELMTDIDSFFFFFHDSLNICSGFILQQTNSNLWKIMIYRQATIVQPK